MAMDAGKFIGLAPERLTLREKAALLGKWMAFQVYTPQELPLRRIEALGASVIECIQQLQRRGLDPRKFEFEVVR